MTENPKPTQELVDRCYGATGPDKELGRDILWAMGKRVQSDISYPTHSEDPTESLDAALRLYKSPPMMIPSDPRIASAAALELAIGNYLSCQ